MSQYLIDELKTKENVTVTAGCEVVEVRGERELDTIVLRDVAEGSLREERTNALFVFIGAEAHTQWLGGFVATDARGYVLTGRSAVGTEQRLAA